MTSFSGFCYTSPAMSSSSFNELPSENRTRPFTMPSSNPMPSFSMPIPSNTSMPSFSMPISSSSTMPSFSMPMLSSSQLPTFPSGSTLFPSFSMPSFSMPSSFTMPSSSTTIFPITVPSFRQPTVVTLKAGDPIYLLPNSGCQILGIRGEPKICEYKNNDDDWIVECICSNGFSALEIYYLDGKIEKFLSAGFVDPTKYKYEMDFSY